MRQGKREKPAWWWKREITLEGMCTVRIWRESMYTGMALTFSIPATGRCGIMSMDWQNLTGILTVL